MHYDNYCTRHTSTQLKKINSVFKNNDSHLNLNSTHGITSSDKQNNLNYHFTFDINKKLTFI